MRTILVVFLLVDACFGCINPDCYGLDGLPQTETTPQVHRAMLDGSVTLDCGDARKCVDRAAERNGRCTYKVEWLRLAGCSDAQIPLIDNTNTRFTAAVGPTNEIIAENGRFEQIGLNGLRIRRLQKHDSGVWACQLVARQNGSDLARSIVHRTFMVHVRQRNTRTKRQTQRIQGGLTCMDITNNYVSCREDQICARQTLVTAGANSTHQQAYGCVALNQLPNSVFTRFAGPPAQLCHTFRQSRFCQQSNPRNNNIYMDSTSHCCYCFTDDCNRFAMDWGTLKWTWPSDHHPDSSVTCYELAQMQRTARSTRRSNKAQQTNAIALCVILSLGMSLFTVF